MSLEPGLWECETCRSIVRRDQIDGVCETCGRRTCINCARTCDRCQRIFCMYHVETKEVWRQGEVSRISLCERCSFIWGARL